MDGFDTKMSTLTREIIQATMNNYSLLYYPPQFFICEHVGCPNRIIKMLYMKQQFLTPKAPILYYCIDCIISLPLDFFKDF